MTMLVSDVCNIVNPHDKALCILLDECVTRRLVVSLPADKKIDVEHSVDVAGLGWGANDEDIMQYAMKTDRILVTQDVILVHECLRRNVAVAKYHMGKATFYDGSISTLQLGAHYNYNKKHVRMTVEKRPRTIRYCLVGVYLRLRRYYRKYVMKQGKRIIFRLFGWPLRKYRDQQRKKQKARSLRISKCKICGTLCKDTLRLRNHMKNSHYASLANDPLKLAVSAKSLSQYRQTQRVKLKQ
jgi:predicted nuclease of predicted toxin-antitoxin system